jgi:diacylglycerol kinase (ATP)
MMPKRESATALRRETDLAACARPLRVGVLSNRLSTRNRRSMARIDRLLARHADVPHAAIEDWACLPDAMDRLAAADLDAIAVNGGDGTVVGMLTELRRRAPVSVPAVAVLASGNTNLIAGDVGIPGAPDRALSRLLAAAGSPGALTLAERRLIRVEQPGEPARYGFFLGALAILRAILLTRRILHPLGVNHGLANVCGLGLGALRVLVGRNTEEWLLTPVPVELAFNDEPSASDDYSVLMATSLDRLPLGTRPFWGTGPGTIRTTMVRGPGDRPLRSLLPLLRGRPSLRMARSGYVSRNADRLIIGFEGRFALDGEIYPVERERPITLSDGGPVRFLRC